MTSYHPSDFYNNSLTSCNKSGFQKHHLIPVQIYRRASFSKLFSRARKAGFDLRDFKTNGIYLPAKEKLAIESGRPLHRGPHPQYNDMVSDQLCLIEKSLHSQKLDQKYNEKLMQSILLMQKSLRELLLRKPCSITLNKRDPMSRDVDFSHLDADIDFLWSNLGKNDKILS